MSGGPRNIAVSPASPGSDVIEHLSYYIYKKHEDFSPSCSVGEMDLVLMVSVPPLSQEWSTRNEEWRGPLCLYQRGYLLHSASMSTDKQISTTSHQNCPGGPEMSRACQPLQGPGRIKHLSHIYKGHGFPGPPDSFGEMDEGTGASV